MSKFKDVKIDVVIDGALEARHQITNLAASVSDLDEFVRVKCLFSRCVNNSGHKKCLLKRITMSRDKPCAYYLNINATRYFDERPCMGVSNDMCYR